MGLLACARVMRRARRNRGDTARWFGRRPAILLGMSAYESGQLLSRRVPSSLKYLAMTEVSTLADCPFCMDMGSALSMEVGVTEEQLRDLPRFRESDRFSEVEKLALELAEAMTATPIAVTDELRDALLAHLTKGQLTELVSAIATENLWSRQNAALGIRPVGFADGRFCVLPERAG
jgi:alkylhydroperoxidase family enzyme